jgi:subtilisin family serine protease
MGATASDPGDFDVDGPEAWNYCTGNPSVLVGIMDSGLDVDHPDLAPILWTNPGEIASNGVDDDGNGYVDDVHGWSAVSRDGDLTDYVKHGTGTSSVACAAGNDGVGMAGVAWNCRLVMAKVTNDGGVDYQPQADGIKYLTDVGVRVMNISIRSRNSSPILESAIGYALEKGVFICAAAGNDGQRISVYPAAYDNVVSVAAINKNGGRFHASNYSPTVDVCAPGEDILFAKPGGIYELNSGTSFASPFVAGIAALALSKNPALTAGELEELIINNVKPIDPSLEVGRGVVSAKLVVEACGGGGGGGIIPPGSGTAPGGAPEKKKKGGCGFTSGGGYDDPNDIFGFFAPFAFVIMACFLLRRRISATQFSFRFTAVTR